MDEVPCKTCGKPTPSTGTVLCNNCWEVERRIEEYLESENGRRFIRTKLAEHEEYHAAY